VLARSLGWDKEIAISEAEKNKQWLMDHIVSSKSDKIK